MMNIEIERLHKEHWPEVREIYEMGIQTGKATFETKTPSWEIWSATHDLVCRLVAVEEETRKVLGWVALAPTSNRPVYEGVGETSIYIHDEGRGKRIGTRLMKELIYISEREGYWTLQAGIMPENVESIRIHENAGFREVGRREKVGKLNGEWRDVLLYERRSKIVGIE